MKALWLSAGLPAALLTGLLFYAVAVEPYALERHDLRVSMPGLPDAFEGYRILHLTDFEATGPGARERMVSGIAREARPDVIVVTGDLVRKRIPDAARWRGYLRMAAYLGSLKAPDGVWFVQGHGELPSRVNQDRLERILSEAGVRMLWDDVAVIRRGGSALALAGIRVHDYGGKGRWQIDPSGRIRQGPGDRPAYLELAAPGSEGWTDVEITGRLRFSSPEDWIGLTARSRLGVGEDRFYMAVRRERLPYLAPSAHGTTYDRGSLSWRRRLDPGPWHRFRMVTRTVGEAVQVKARSWDDGNAEPAAWELEYEDAGPGRILAGRPGLYAEGPGTKEFDDLRVTFASGEPAAGAWREPAGADFLLALLTRVPEGAPMILLSHTPDIFPDAREVGIPLVLAGHTQGGQIRLPLLGPLVTDTRLGRDYAAGVFLEGRSTLFVNRGVGTTRVPLRFLCPPEAAVITLAGQTPHGGKTPS